VDSNFLGLLTALGRCEVEHLLIVIVRSILTFLGDMLIRLLELFPDHKHERMIKRQAKLQLMQGLQLLDKKMFHEADIHFGAALRINPEIAHFLSKRKIRRVMEKLDVHRGLPNVTRLWLEMEKAKQK